MERQVEAPGNWPAPGRIVCLPVDLGIKAVASGVEMPASNADDRIIVGTINDLHVAHCGVAAETTSLLVKMKI